MEVTFRSTLSVGKSYSQSGVSHLKIIAFGKIMTQPLLNKCPDGFAVADTIER